MVSACIERSVATIPAAWAGGRQTLGCAGALSSIGALPDGGERFEERVAPPPNLRVHVVAAGSELFLVHGQRIDTMDLRTASGLSLYRSTALHRLAPHTACWFTWSVKTPVRIEQYTQGCHERAADGAHLRTARMPWEGEPSCASFSGAGYSRSPAWC